MTRTTNRGAAGAALLVLVLALVVGAAPAGAATVSLLLPQATAFAILGHSCGGIQETATAFGFDPTSGYPTGVVTMSTRCGGSGRGGGYHVTTYSASAGVRWDFAGNVLGTVVPAPAPPSPPYAMTDANGDQLTNSGGHAYLDVPAPGAPTGVAAVQVSDILQVSWTPAPPNPAVIVSSTLTATPVGSAAPVLTATVSGAGTTGSLGPLQPQTTYAVTVVSTTAGGSGPASDPVTVTTGAASVVPAAPTGVTARWTAPGSPSDTLVATWSAATGGDSPVDAYQVTIDGSDGGGTFTQTVDGVTLAATFAVSDVPDWTVRVRAHDAAGWSAWSAAAQLGGA